MVWVLLVWARVWWRLGLRVGGGRVCWLRCHGAGAGAGAGAVGWRCAQYPSDPFLAGVVVVRSLFTRHGLAGALPIRTGPWSGLHTLHSRKLLVHLRTVTPRSEHRAVAREFGTLHWRELRFGTGGKRATKKVIGRVHVRNQATCCILHQQPEEAVPTPAVWGRAGSGYTCMERRPHCHCRTAQGRLCSPRAGVQHVPSLFGSFKVSSRASINRSQNDRSMPVVLVRGTPQRRLRVCLRCSWLARGALTLQVVRASL